MRPRRAILIAVVLYLTVDYCDPSLPGVFSFESESLYVDTIKSSSSELRPVVALAVPHLPAAIVETVTPHHASAAAPTAQRRTPRLTHLPRGALTPSLAVSPGASEDH
jgi:hypothetical protein